MVVPLDVNVCSSVVMAIAIAIVLDCIVKQLL